MRLATRGSALALWQASFVADRIRAAAPGTDVELVVVSTTGDRLQDRPVWELGGQGVFVKEVQAAVLDGRADAGVHSAKDLPSTPAPGLELAAFPVRADPRDVLVGATLDGLGPGAPVATGSVRRRAQLAWLRPDLTFTSLRGNIATRLERVPSGGAIVMAAAALERLGLNPPVSEVLSPSVMLPQVAQGAIAVECRSADQAARDVLEAIDDAEVRACVTAERAYLARLGGGCDLPVGAHAVLEGTGEIRVDALLASLDGRIMLRATAHGPRSEAASLGSGLAGQILDTGGRSVLGEAGKALP